MERNGTERNGLGTEQILGCRTEMPVFQQILAPRSSDSEKQLRFWTSTFFYWPQTLEPKKLKVSDLKVAQIIPSLVLGFKTKVVRLSCTYLFKYGLCVYS